MRRKRMRRKKKMNKVSRIAGILLIGVVIGLAIVMTAADLYRPDHTLPNAGNRRNVEMTSAGDTSYYPLAVYSDNFIWNHVYGEIAIGTAVQAIAIDLSDTVNYTHDYTGSIVVQDVMSEVCVTNIGGGSVIAEYTIRYGVVVRTGSTNGDILWFHAYQVGTDERLLTNAQECYIATGPKEVDLTVESDQAKYITGNIRDVNDTDWDNDDTKFTMITTAVGNTAVTAYPGVGDMVIELIEGVNGLNFDGKFHMVYRTKE
jgi:hypothetical protein